MCEKGRCARWPHRTPSKIRTGVACCPVTGTMDLALSRQTASPRAAAAARRTVQPTASRAALSHLLSCGLTLPLGLKPWRKRSFSVKQQEVGSEGASSQQGLLRTARGTETREINPPLSWRGSCRKEPARPGEAGPEEHRAPVPGLGPSRQATCL